MHSNAANIEAFSYAACFGRDGSFARHMVKLLMAAWMMFGMATQAQAEGNVNQTLEKTGYWTVYGAPFIIVPTSATSAAQVCETVNKAQTSIFFPSWQKTYFGTEPNISYFASLGALNCLFKDNITGIVQPYNTVVPITRGVCPANSTPGMPCTCDAGYKPDPTITKCIPVVLHTISLHNISPVLIEGEGLGGEMAPNASRNAYANVGVPGVAITLTTAAPFAAGSLTLSPHQGSSGVNGRLNFIVTAPSVGGTHTVTAICDGGKCSNQATGTIVVTACPVPPLKPLPANDACTASLEKGLGKDVDGACPKLSDNMKAQMQCFADKITATNVTASPQIPYAGPTATYRTTAYQAHLQEIWDKMIDLDNLEEPAEIEACKIRRTEIVAAKGCNGGHCLEFRPADDSKHSIGQAFDISKSTIQGLLQELTPLPSPIMSKQQKKQEQMFLIASWLAQPTACNLTWGGSFNDRVHFQLP